MRVTVSDIGTQEEALERLARLAAKATVHPMVRRAAGIIVSECASRDDECELQAVFDAVKYGDSRVAGLARGVRYVGDPTWTDFFTAPNRLLSECANGACQGDCLPGETLVLGAGYKPVAISDVRPGDTIMGDGRWVKVTQFWNKGRQGILEFHLNNGGVLRCTPDHKVFRVPKVKGCAGSREDAEEVRASELRPGDDLLTAERLPVGSESMDSDKAWLLGLHVAEGWVDYSSADKRPLRVGISGLDGYRKEENKARLQALCASWNVATRWHEKYLAINDEETARWLAGCGRGAKNKHLPSLNFDESTVRAVLSGLAADADIRNGVHGTISPELALQLRLLYRMLGRSAHIRRVDEHGGFGANPIYRVTPRPEGDTRRRHARIKSISEGEPTETFDIEVEGHRFYLPETDLIVHNCDDHTALIVALLGSLGWTVGLRAWGEPDRPGEYVHVYAVAGFPKRSPQKVLGLDTTVESSSVGWEPPGDNVITAWFGLED